MSDIGYTFLFVMLNILGVVAQTTPNLRLPKVIDDHILLDITHLTKDHNNGFSYDLLSVYVANDHNDYTTLSAVQGKFTIVENDLIFSPYFPFERGLAYVVKVNCDVKEMPAYIPFQIGEKDKVDEAKVLSIFPTSDLLPENVLRFYMYFQTPMKQEVALKHIKLIDEEGNVDDHAFMKFKEELWSNDGKRLTLLFDPGRIKRGVTTNIKEGPALENGRRYHLSISNDWLDVYGQKLIETSTKEIKVIEAYRTKINLEEWLVNQPRYGSLDKLTIDFDRIMDHALIRSMMQIKDGSDNLVEGHWEILNSEQQIHFIPKNTWKKGLYKMDFDTRIEDVAGNNFQNLLDHHKEDVGNNEKLQTIEFVII